MSTTGHVGTWVSDDPNAMTRFARHATQTGDLAPTVLGANLSQQAESVNKESSRL
ncbi:hypothetical protein [Mastigocoleus sp. MO_188.B34]|uniref:hypothetical protein n=1 Tax=Mastigocoleus sp. MO_188.B34 TaxID=3036635 RepID=UPI0026140A2E|nr:hypothetical protein [Mastigocoleus sp. MO_188.B34]MDJ0695740.1 hypothetical protein [Mastigocoleus sp. MO_188.B34]